MLKLCQGLTYRVPAQMKAKGKFITDKIDLLVSYLVVHPFLQLFSKLPQGIKVCT